MTTLDNPVMTVVREIRFFVPGIPRPGGSKRVFPIRKGGVLTGKFIVTDAAGQANKDWRASVAHEAHLVDIPKDWNHDAALELELEFRLPRPKGHIRHQSKSGMTDTLKEKAPRFHVCRPDAGKLARSTTDALTSILWRDDAQIVKETHSKAYSAQAGCWVIIREAQ